MNIITAPSPIEIDKVVTAEVAALGRSKGYQQSETEAGGGMQPILQRSFAVYHVDAASPRQVSQPSDDAHQVGWKSLVRQGTDLNTVEVIAGRVSKIDRGQFASAVERAISFALSRVSDSQTYEARILTFGQAGNSLLWLHGREGEDRYFSLGEVSHEEDGNTVMRERERVSSVRRSAAKQVRSLRLDEIDDESGG